MARRAWMNGLAGIVLVGALGAPALGRPSAPAQVQIQANVVELDYSAHKSLRDFNFDLQTDGGFPKIAGSQLVFTGTGGENVVVRCCQRQRGMGPFTAWMPAGYVAGGPEPSPAAAVGFEVDFGFGCYGVCFSYENDGLMAKTFGAAGPGTPHFIPHTNEALLGATLVDNQLTLSVKPTVDPNSQAITLAVLPVANDSSYVLHMVAMGLGKGEKVYAGNLMEVGENVNGAVQDVVNQVALAEGLEVQAIGLATAGQTGPAQALVSSSIAALETALTTLKATPIDPELLKDAMKAGDNLGLAKDEDSKATKGLGKGKVNGPLVHLERALTYKRKAAQLLQQIKPKKKA